MGIGGVGQRGAGRLVAAAALGLAVLSACSGTGPSSSAPTATSPPSAADGTGSAGGAPSTGSSLSVGTTTPLATAPLATAPRATAPRPGPPRNLVELRGDGLGVVTFGDAADTVVATLTSIYGPPDVDSGWLSEPGGRIRRIAFGPLMLTLRGDPGAERFAGWAYQPRDQASEPMRTAEGGAVGLTFAELVATVGPTSPVPAGSVYLQCWPSTGGTVCASSSSRFAQATPTPDETVSALSAAAP